MDRKQAADSKRIRCSEVCLHPEELLLSTHVCEQFFREKGVWESFRGETVLDIGCGTGFFTEKIARTAARVLACDISFGNAEACKRLAKTSQVFGLNADAQRLPFKADSFDSVFVNSVAEHLDDPELFFDEVRRVLKPGGRFVLSVDITPGISWRLYRLTFLFDKMIASNHPMLHRKTGLSDPRCPEFLLTDRLLASLERRFLIEDKERFAGLIFNLLQVSLVITNKFYQILSGNNFSEDHYANHIPRLNRPIFRIYRALLPLLCLAAYPRFLTFDAVYYFVRMRKPGS
jgi:SAM-dependent methyltransferase